MRLLGGALSVVLLAGLTGCSQPISTPSTASAPTTPQVSLSEEPSAPAESSSVDFDNAIGFVHDVYLDNFDALGPYVADNSVAARYVTHQQAYAEVEENNGTLNKADPDDVDVDGDAAANTVSVEDRSTDPTSHAVWQDFQFSGGKITTFEVKGKRALDARLWTTKASDSSKGVKATLVSAYEGNSGALRVVVSLSSDDRDASVNGASYTPDNGYKHEDAANIYPDIDKDGKVLTYFEFTKSKIGGKVRIELGDSDGYDLTTLTLKVH